MQFIFDKTQQRHILSKIYPPDVNLAHQPQGILQPLIFYITHSPPTANHNTLLTQPSQHMSKAAPAISRRKCGICILFFITSFTSFTTFTIRPDTSASQPLSVSPTAPGQASVSALGSVPSGPLQSYRCFYWLRLPFLL